MSDQQDQRMMEYAQHMQPGPSLLDRHDSPIYYRNSHFVADSTLALFMRRKRLLQPPSMEMKKLKISVDANLTKPDWEESAHSGHITAQPSLNSILDLRPLADYTRPNSSGMELVLYQESPYLELLAELDRAMDLDP